MLLTPHKTIFCTLLGLLLCTLGFAKGTPFPRQSAVPGGVIRIDLAPAQQPPRAFFAGDRVMVVSNGPGKWQAIVGIPLVSKIGALQIKVNDSTGSAYSREFFINAKKYTTQHLKIRKKRHVNPNKKDLARIGKEKKTIRKLLATWNEQQPPKKHFRLPVKGRLSSPFGLKRFYNKQPRSPHKGIDIAAPLGRALRSPASATVIGVGQYFFNGNTVFLDHGQGLVTMYCHMNKIAVKVGQQLSTGDKFGSIGKTGRATGPHVHWGVFLNKTAVDPLLFLAKDALRGKKSPR